MAMIPPMRIMKFVCTLAAGFRPEELLKMISMNLQSSVAAELKPKNKEKVRRYNSALFLSV
jgi:hypothetical protein